MEDKLFNDLIESVTEAGAIIRGERRVKAGNRVGGGITPAVLPHHRAYGSVPRRFLSTSLSL